METQLKQPLTNLQLELLKLFSMTVSTIDLLELKKFLVQYFANKSMDMADEAWDKNNWNKKDEKKFLNDHLRTPYKYLQ